MRSFSVLLGLAKSVWAVGGDSTRTPDTVGIRQMAPTVVHGVRRFEGRRRLGVSEWGTPAGMGQSGPVDGLRDLPGVSGEGDASGRFSTTGAPLEGTVIAWDGAEIPWPWHFGGLFGALDAASVGEVTWDPSGSGATPARGGGSLDSRSRASTGVDGFHALAELGTISGSIGVWGGRDGFSWQATGRRTWLEPALQLARSEGWTDQSTELLFWDGSAAVGWVRGPFRMHAGVYSSRDTISLAGSDPTSGEDVSWRNVAVPAGILWAEEGSSVEFDGSWSHYEKNEADGLILDTLDLASASLLARREISDGFRLEWGYRVRRWVSRYRDWHGPSPAFPGDSRRMFQEPHVGARFAAGGWLLGAWGGFGLDGRDPDAPEGGVELGWSRGYWKLHADLTRKLLPLGTLLDVPAGSVPPAPTWFLPPGSSTRSTLFQFDVSREKPRSSTESGTSLRAILWARSLDGIWSWDAVEFDHSLLPDGVLRRPYLSDGGSAGADASLRVQGERLEGGFRQVLSADVVRRRPDGTGEYQVLWSPWDQRWQTEIDAGWTWFGGTVPPPGAAFLRSRVALHLSSGLQRPAVDGWEFTGTGQVVLPGNNADWHLDWPVVGVRRAPYSRLDFTPFEFGREGSWMVWWHIVNVLGVRNSIGWFPTESYLPPQEIDQIPFLPVVFGARIQF